MVANLRYSWPKYIDSPLRFYSTVKLEEKIFYMYGKSPDLSYPNEESCSLILFPFLSQFNDPAPIE